MGMAGTLGTRPRDYTSPVPAFELDFTLGSLTCARSGAVLAATGGTGGTRVAPSGYIVPASAPRFNHDPVTLACKGLLCEGQRTNLLTRSADFANAAWSAQNILSKTNAATTGPDGTASGASIIPSTANGDHSISAGAGTASIQAYTLTAYAKPNGYNWIRLSFGNTAGAAGNYAFFNVSTGAVGTVGAGTTTASIAAAGNGWYRCRATSTAASAAAINGDIYIVNADNTFTWTPNGTSGIYLWGAQLEAGSFPTSVIPTSGAQVTRTADTVSASGTNFTSWFTSSSQGAMVVEAIADYAIPTSSFPDVLAICDNSFNNIFLLSSNQFLNTRFGLSAAGVSQADANATGNLTVGATTKWGMVWATNDIASAANGAAGATDSTATMPTGLSALFVGTGPGAGPWYGHVQKARYFPTRITNAQLQAQTA